MSALGLDALAKDPAQARALLRPGAIALAFQAAAALTALAARLAELEAETGARPVASLASGDLLTAKELGQKLHVSASAIYEARKTFPVNTFAVSWGTRSVRFRGDLVDEYLADPEVYRVRHAAQAGAGLRSRRWH